MTGEKINVLISTGNWQALPHFYCDPRHNQQHHWHLLDHHNLTVAVAGSWSEDKDDLCKRSIFLGKTLSQNWKPQPCTKGQDGVWTLSLQLPPGRYEYKYIINGKWEWDPTTLSIPSVSGSVNNVLEVYPRGSKMAHSGSQVEQWKRDTFKSVLDAQCVQVFMDRKASPKKTYKIVMVRHGESVWNKENRFCGWVDAALSEKGIDEAKAGGKALKAAGYKFDCAHTSVLQRAQTTLKSVLHEIGQSDLKTHKSWRLNERHYGGLTGLNKADTAEKYGDKQVQIWRRSFDIPPPPMGEDHPFYDELTKDPRYKDEPSKKEFPMFESLKLTIGRTLPYWNNVIVPQIKDGKNIIIAAHGNSLRGIVKHLDNMSDDDIMELNLPTGIPFVYELDENMKPIVSMKFLGDEETVKKAIASVAAQGKAKKDVPKKTYKVVMVRHGESVWNKENRFCGWVDAALSEKGIDEAKAGGKALKAAGYKFNRAHTSVLQRAQTTLKNVLHEIGQSDIPVHKNWRLNERHYGGLTGMNKAETAEKHGDKQVQIWRRSFDIPPPPMEKGHPFYDELTKDPRYKDEPSKNEFPMFESLKLTIKRTLPYWNNVIVPQIKEGQNLIIAAHGNSLRGIVKHLDNMSDEDIMELNLPTGIPFVYELDENMKPIVSMKFLGDEETVKKAIASVAAQGKAKKDAPSDGKHEMSSMVAHHVTSAKAKEHLASMVAHKTKNEHDKNTSMVAHVTRSGCERPVHPTMDTECIRKFLDKKYCPPVVQPVLDTECVRVFMNKIHQEPKRKSYQIVMVRHGESTWNLENRFCGWVDASLSKKGVQEAISGGKALNNAGFSFDLAHTSVLQRAQHTLKNILQQIGQPDIPVHKNWRLNERHYGGLTGLNKAETAEKHGEKQVQIWRRSFDTPPPPMEQDHPYHVILTKDERYKHEPSKGEFPKNESLKLTIARTLPYWDNVIVPQIKAGKKILIAAHGNSLRGIVKHLDNLSDEAIMELNLPTGIPFVYELDENMKPIVSMKFLGDEETVAKAIASVAAQGKAKK